MCIKRIKTSVPIQCKTIPNSHNNSSSVFTENVYFDVICLLSVSFVIFVHQELFSIREMYDYFTRKINNTLQPLLFHNRKEKIFFFLFLVLWNSSVHSPIKYDTFCGDMWNKSFFSRRAKILLSFTCNIFISRHFLFMEHASSSLRSISCKPEHWGW